ncbi:MAG: hypothetical protein A3205_06155 [Methanomassiliicoccales archaeon Mx-03]|nr:MAG: hypothetical protein A3205_06155 [Methanomassiliicoccales archaeon Mx-03]
MISNNVTMTNSKKILIQNFLIKIISKLFFDNLFIKMHFRNYRLLDNYCYNIIVITNLTKTMW